MQKCCTKCAMHDMSGWLCYAYCIMQNTSCKMFHAMCCVEHLKYASFIKFWYVLRLMNTISFDNSNSTLANFVSPVNNILIGRSYDILVNKVFMLLKGMVGMACKEHGCDCATSLSIKIIMIPLPTPSRFVCNGLNERFDDFIVDEQINDSIPCK